jgi:hypothetical protein
LDIEGMNTEAALGGSALAPVDRLFFSCPGSILKGGFILVPYFVPEAVKLVVYF